MALGRVFQGALQADGSSGFRPATITSTGFIADADLQRSSEVASIEFVLSLSQPSKQAKALNLTPFDRKTGAKLGDLQLWTTLREPTAGVVQAQTPTASEAETAESGVIAFIQVQHDSTAAWRAETRAFRLKDNLQSIT